MPFPLLAVLSIASTAIGVIQGIQSSNFQAAQYKAQAKREENSARQQEIERKQNLLKALAAQNAARAAQGVAANQGSPASMMRSDFDQEEQDKLVDDANAEHRISTARENASQAKISGRFKAASSLLDFGTRRIKTGDW